MVFPLLVRLHVYIESRPWCYTGPSSMLGSPVRLLKGVRNNHFYVLLVPLLQWTLNILLSQNWKGLLSEAYLYYQTSNLAGNCAVLLLNYTPTISNITTTIFPICSPSLMFVWHPSQDHLWCKLSAQQDRQAVVLHGNTAGDIEWQAEWACPQQLWAGDWQADKTV